MFGSQFFDHFFLCMVLRYIKVLNGSAPPIPFCLMYAGSTPLAANLSHVREAKDILRYFIDI